MFKHIIKLFTPRPRKSVRPLTRIEELVQKWQQANFQKLEHVYSSDMSIIRVSVRKRRIEEYRKYLEMINNHFSKDESLYPVVVAANVEQIYIGDFFLTEKNTYLDPLKEVEVFRGTVIDFLTHHERTTNVIDKTLSMERNLRCTSPVIAELHHLLDILKNDQ